MGIFTHEIVLLDVLFKEARDSQSCFLVSAVSYRFQQCCWHRWNRFTDTAETLDLILIAVSTVSLTTQKPFQWCHWHRRNNFSSVNDNAEMVDIFCGWNPYDILNLMIMVVSAVTLLKWFPRWHSHRWNSNNVNYLGEYEAICETVLACESGP
jgi:L-lactate permease